MIEPTVSDADLQRERVRLRANFAIGEAISRRFEARGIDARNWLDLELNRDEVSRIVDQEIARYFALPN
jgi:hypothetical protein